MEALFARAARLVKVGFSPPQAGDRKDHRRRAQSGMVFGFAGPGGRHRQARQGRDRGYGTGDRHGGLAELIAPHAETIDTVDPLLTLEGLRLVWNRNA